LKKTILEDNIDTFPKVKKIMKIDVIPQSIKKIDEKTDKIEQDNTESK
jgi:hypothetical protein